MKRSAENPTIVAVADGRVDTLHRHPAYAQIRASRVSGQAVLYGSELRHQHYMTVSISKSELRRSLSMDWPHGTDELIEVAMSEAQWAAFVSSPNCGSGVQCTLARHNGKMIPGLPDVPKRFEQFTDETKETLKDVAEAHEKLKSQIEGLKLSGKAKEDLLSTLNQAQMNLTSNLQFVGDKFVEHMENVTQAAKIEVNAYVQATIARAGLTAHALLEAPQEATVHPTLNDDPTPGS